MTKAVYSCRVLIPVFLAIGCATASNRPPSPSIIVPPPGFTRCKAQSFIEHRVGESESLQDISELYLGKRSQWNEIAACNPDIDPLLMRAGSIVYVPVQSQKRVGTVVSAKTPASQKLKKAPPQTSTVAIRGEEKRSSGDLPKPRQASSTAIEPVVPPALPTAEEFVVLPPAPAAPAETEVLTTIAPDPVREQSPKEEAAAPDPEYSPLLNPNHQTASTLLTCTGKDCLPIGN